MKQKYCAHIACSRDQNAKNTDLLSDPQAIDWQKAEKAEINNFPWAEAEGAYYPISSFYILHQAENLYILLLTQGEYEKEPRAEVEIAQGPVHQDSCLEFFLAPYVDSDLYFNFEVNPKGYYKIAVGGSRKDRYQLQPEDLSDFIIQGLKPDQVCLEDESANYDWGVFLKIPLKSLDKIAKNLMPKATNLTRDPDIMRMNVYKCGDLTEVPHFACWSNVQNATPDFHRSEFFGEINLSDK